MALLLQGLTLFGDRCHVLYQQSVKQGVPLALPIGSRLQETFQRKTAVHLLQQFNFHAAAQACRQAGVHDPLVTHLLQYATSRLWFAFGEAEHALTQAIAKSANGKMRTDLAEMKEDLYALKGQKPDALLGELYHNGRIAWENGRFLDFLTRWFRFQQTALQLAIDKMPDDTFLLPINKEKLTDSDMRQMAIKQMVNGVQPQSITELSNPQRTGLLEKMQKAYTLAELKGLCFDLGIEYENVAGETLESKVSELILHCQRHGLLSSLLQANRRKRGHVEWPNLETGESENSLAQLVLALHRLESVRPLYEQSILAGGVGGVTESSMTSYAVAISSLEEDKSGRDISPLQDMAAICSALAINIENPFRQIRDALIDKLKT